MLSSMRPSPEVSSVYIMLSSAAVIWQTHKLLCVYISKVKGMVGTCVAIENSLFMTLLFFSSISILVSWSNNKTYSDLTEPLSLMIMCVFFHFYKTCNINHTYFDLLFWGPNICGLSKSTFFFFLVCYIVCFLVCLVISIERPDTLSRKQVHGKYFWCLELDMCSPLLALSGIVFVLVRVDLERERCYGSVALSAARIVHASQHLQCSLSLQ